MSGRDLRSFLTNHRIGTFHHASKSADSLHKKYSAGSAPRFTPVDYNHLLSHVQKHKDEVAAGFQRFKTLTQKGKETTEMSLLKKHQEIWRREKTRLVDMKHRALSELNQWRTELLVKDDPCLKQLLTELTAYELELSDEQKQFEELTVTPVCTLTRELKCMGVKGRTEVDQSGSSPMELIVDEIELVKEQQNKIRYLLQEEFDILQSDLEEFMDNWRICNHGNSLVVKETELVAPGVPQEVVDLECPDEKLYSDGLNEFVQLDDQFTSLLNDWQSTNKSVINLPYGGWSRLDAELFTHLLEQYPPALPNRRRLYLDRVMREWPDKSREEIVAHEGWHLSLKHYHSVRKTLLTSWVKHRQELAERISTLFGEATRSLAAQDLAKAASEDWKHKCYQLYCKVQAWRDEKVKVQQAEAERVAKQQALDEEKRRQEEQRLQLKRDQQKYQIKQYHSKLETHHQSNLEQLQRLQKVAKIEKKKQAVHNLGRVEYRHEKHLEKMAADDAARALVIKEERDQERRLDQLRQQVKVQVTSDPERVQQDTVASHTRHTALTDPNFTLQQPLYTLHSYTSDKITSDPRVRLETALREAGLHTTAYARKALSRIPPPHRPRPDQISSLFKN